MKITGARRKVLGARGKTEQLCDKFTIVGCG